MTHTPTPWKPYEVQVGKGVRSDNLGSEIGHVAFFEEEDDCARAGACVSFFHGRDIPTERIPEGGINEVIDTLKHTVALLQMEGLEWDENSAFLKAKALLAKLGVEP